METESSSMETGEVQTRRSTSQSNTWDTQTLKRVWLQREESSRCCSWSCSSFSFCWTPLYVVQTWSIIDFMGARSHISPLAMNFIHLLSYVSSCCNPITYCFMNKKFRQGFLAAFRCRPRHTHRSVWRDASSFGPSQRSGKTVTNAPYIYYNWHLKHNLATS